MIPHADSPLPETEVHHLPSAHVGDMFKVLVGHCGSLRAADARVLFMGDPWANFGTAVEMARLLRYSEDIPPLLIVAVGYDLVTIDDNAAVRSRDFTPTIDRTRGGDDPAMMGGAGRFLTFLRDELKPWVRERYGVDPDDSAFFGDSLGGLFAMWTLLTEPGLFPRYGIGSPSLWWDDSMMFGQEAAYASAHDDLPATVFVSVGELETPAGDVRWREQLPPERRAKAEADAEAEARVGPPVDMVADAARMVAALRSRAYPSLDIAFEVLPGEYHHTAPSLNLSRALRYLFDAPR